MCLIVALSWISGAVLVIDAHAFCPLPRQGCIAQPSGFVRTTECQALECGFPIKRGYWR